MAADRMHRMVLFSLLGTVMYAAKMAMAGLPNIEPVSLLVIVYTLVFGRKALLPIYIYVALELVTWGFGLWNICYLYVWLVLFAVTTALRRMDSPLGWAVVSGAFGLCFGLLCAPVTLAVGGWAAAVSWWVSGIPYDLTHCAGNFAVALLLYRPCVSVLRRLSAGALGGAGGRS